MRRRESHLYQEIAESLRRQIASGELTPGDKLPPVRKMAQRWHCTPGTISRAYSQLAQEGMVEGHRGGGTRVTGSALRSERPALGWAMLVNRAEGFLLEALRDGHTPSEAESALSVAVARWREMQRSDAAQGSPIPPDATLALRFAGSHDLTVELLARMLREETDARLSIQYIGSLGGLMALARGEADVAGSHLWDEKADTYNLPFVRRLFPGQRMVLLTLAQRSLGLMVKPGNPQGLKNLADLTHPGVRFTNRQPGSGTRVWLDAQLKAGGIPRESVAGYEQEELTHLAVARAVEQGTASAGLGIYAAASTFGLGFVPLTQERYDLVFPETVWHAPAAQALVNVIRSSRLKASIIALGGYELSDSGQESWIS